MTHFNVQDYKGQLLGLAVTIGIGGFFVPHNTVKTVIVASMTGVSIGSLIAYKSSQSSTDYQLSKYIQNNELKVTTEDNRVKELTKQLTEANNDRTKLKSDLSQKQSDFNVLSALNTSNVNKLKDLSKLAIDHEHLKQQINILTNKLTRANQDLATVRTNLINKLTEHLENTTRWIIKQIETKLKLDDYKTIHVQLADLLDYVNTKYDVHLNLLVKINESNNFAEMMLTALRIMDESTGLKVRYNKTLNIDNIKTLEAYMNNEGQLVSKDKATHAMSMLKQKLDANYSGTLDKIRANDENLDNLWGNVQDLIGQIDERNLEIDRLKHQLIELQKPQRWTLATSNRILDIGNKFIEFFYTNTGIILDRAFSESDEYSANLYFQIDRNSRGILPKELSEHSEALQQFCRLLHPVEFSYDANKALIMAEVTLKIREKVKQSVTDIYRLITPASKFGETLRRYHNHKTGGLPTLRVMTRTGGGKQIAVKNLLESYVSNESGFEIWLSDPQDGSSEDFWNIPKVATDSDSAKILLKGFCDEFSKRKEGTSIYKTQKILGIFDECDKTFDKPEKQSISKIWTEIRHHNMRLVLIGQSGEVGKNGWTWDEMNNCAMLFIGDAIGTAIKHVDDIPALGGGRVNDIQSVYKRVTEWMDEENKIIPVENQYRLGLIIAGGRYEFIEIPPALKGTIEPGKSVIVSTPFESLTQKKSEIVVTTINDAPSLQIKCPHCGSEKFRKHSRVSDATQYRYTCSNVSCKKTFVASVLTNSN